tara:strand:+ start:3163 stop:3927 length:765 start_codon:yes stop_codon:yes gene_type:complete
MDWATIAFWSLLYAGIPAVLAMHLHRKVTKTYKIATPMTILVLAGIAGTANMIGGSTHMGPAETAEALIHLFIPTSIYLIGSCLAIFGGPSPVGPIPKNWRIAGFILMFISIGWIIVQSLQPESLPIQTAKMNDVSISSLLIGTSILGAVGTTVVLSVGEKRWNAAIITIALSIGSIAILAQLSIEKSEYIRDSLQTTIGTIIGVIFALWVTFHVIVLIERNAALPKSTKPITDEEKNLVKRHLEANIGGVKNE